MEDDQVAADRVADYQLADDPAPIAGPSDELTTEWFSLDDEFESAAAPRYRVGITMSLRS